MLSVSWVWWKKVGVVPFLAIIQVLLCFCDRCHHYKVSIFSSPAVFSKPIFAAAFPLHLFFLWWCCKHCCLLSFSFRVSFCSVFANCTPRKWNHYQEANHNNSNKEIMRIQCANQPIQQWLMDHSWPQKKMPKCHFHVSMLI